MMDIIAGCRRDGKNRGLFRRYLLLAGSNNGRIFCLSEDGDTFVIQTGPEFKVLATNKLGEMCMATPAALRGSLIIRTMSKLYRISD